MMNDDRPLKQLFFLALGVVLLAAAGVYVATTRWGSDVSASFSQGSGDGGEEEAFRKLNEQVVREADAQARSQGALAQAQAGKLLQKVAETKDAAEKARVAAARWEQEIPALLTSDAGRRLASDPERIAVFAALQERVARPSEASLAPLLERIAVLEAELERIRSAEIPSISPETSQQFEAQLAEDQTEAKAALTTVEQDLDSVEALVSDASSDAPAEQTLEEALAARRREQAARHARETEERLAAAREQQHQHDMEMEVRKHEEQLIADRKKREAELEAERVRTETAAALAAEQARKDDLRTRATSPAMLAKYAVFLDDGLTYLYGYNGQGAIEWRASKTGVPQPVIMANIKTARILEDFNRFLVAVTNADNDRGAWPHPGDNKDTIDEYRRRFDEFKELAPEWAKMGKLK